MSTTDDLERSKLIHSWRAKFEQFVNLSSVIIFESCNRGQFRNLEVECAGEAGEIVHSRK